MEQLAPGRVEGSTTEQREARSGVILDVTGRLGAQGAWVILRELRTDQGTVHRWETVRDAVPLIESLRAVLLAEGRAEDRVATLFEALEAMRHAAMVNGRLHLPLAEYTTALRHVVHACSDMVEHGVDPRNVWNELFLSTPAPARHDLAAAYVCRLARVLRTHQIAQQGDVLYEMVVRREPRDATFAWLERALRSAKMLEQDPN